MAFHFDSSEYRSSIEAATLHRDNAASLRDAIQKLLKLRYSSIAMAFSAGSSAALTILKSCFPISVVIGDNADLTKSVSQLIFDEPPNLLLAQPNSLVAALEALYTTQEGADFEIYIDGQLFRRCHSWVAQTRWPYFKAMLASGMRESHDGKLNLVGIQHEGGIHPQALEAILEYVYTGHAPNKFEMSLERAIGIIAASSLYLFDTSERTSDVDGTSKLFAPLLNVAHQVCQQPLNLNNCISTMKIALEFDDEELQQRARNTFIMHIKHIGRDKQLRAQLRTLPIDVQMDLLWEGIGSQ
jgi:hypothetical protein